MRDFINSILAFIGTTAVTDAEFAMIRAITPVYDQDLYIDLVAILDSREAVTTTRDRLRYFFLARGIPVGPVPITGKSRILVGEVLDDCP